MLFLLLVTSFIFIETLGIFFQWDQMARDGSVSSLLCLVERDSVDTDSSSYLLIRNGKARRQQTFRLALEIDSKPIVTEQPCGEAGNLSPTVAFEDVTFAYPTSRQRAHKGLNFEVAA